MGGFGEQEYTPLFGEGGYVDTAAQLDVAQGELAAINTQFYQIEGALNSTKYSINPIFEGLDSDYDGNDVSARLDLNVGQMVGLPQGQALVVSPFIGQSDLGSDGGSNNVLRTLGLWRAGTTDYDTTYGGFNVLYAAGPYFAGGSLQLESSDVDFHNYALQSQGSYDGDGHEWGLVLGRTFLLAASGPGTAMPYALFFDASFDGGRSESDYSAFADSAGNTFGKQEVDFSTYGVNGRLHSTINAYGVAWQPFAGVGVHRIVDNHHSFILPAQGAFVGTTVDILYDENTVWTFDGGLDARVGRFTLGSKGYFDTTGPDDEYGGGLSLAVAIGGE